jgi:hypothetical protein
MARSGNSKQPPETLRFGQVAREDTPTEHAAAGRPRYDSGAVTMVSAPLGAEPEALAPAEPAEEDAPVELAEDLTPLPPPRMQASMITEAFSERTVRPSGLGGTVKYHVGVASGGSAGDRRNQRTPTPGVEPRLITGPLPLPPAPLSGVTGTGTRTPEASPFGSLQVVPSRPLTVRELTDPSDARWTLGVWIGGGVLGGGALVASLVALVDGARKGELPLWALVVVAFLALLFPTLRVAEALTVARVRGGGIEVGPNQLPDLWECYREVARRLGMEKPPPLYLYDVVPGEGWLLGLAQGSVTVLPLSACASIDKIELAMGRALGHRRVRHGDALDVALTLPVRLLFQLFVPLSWCGLRLSPILALRAARVYTSDRAACIGAGQLGPVLGDIVNGSGGAAEMMARIDVGNLEVQQARQTRLQRFLRSMGSPRPPLAARVNRLHRFASPHLIRE